MSAILPPMKSTSIAAPPPSPARKARTAIAASPRISTDRTSRRVLFRSMINAGKAYVCDLTADEIHEYRGTPTEPGKESPYRNRGIAENLDLFTRMKAGEFPDGARTLRAKIDMASPNFNMRDPIMYRILRAEHHRTGNQWCIYPMYDYAHGQSDSIEGITPSICTLEFEDHRPLYDWYVEAL